MRFKAFHSTPPAVRSMLWVSKLRATARSWHAVCSPRAMRTRLRRTLVILGVVAAVAITARLAAPLVLERYVNRALADMGDYHGRVTDIELSLVRGGYV